MRKLMTLVFVLAIFAGLGLYMGWFRLGSDKSSGDPNVTITVDQDKMKADKDKVVEKAKDLGSRAEDKVDATVAKTTQAPATQPLQRP